MEQNVFIVFQALYSGACASLIRLGWLESFLVAHLCMQVPRINASQKYLLNKCLRRVLASICSIVYKS